MSALSGYLRHMSLRAKMIFSYLLLLLLPMSLLAGFAFQGIERLLVEQGQSAYQETIRQAALNMSNIMDGYVVSATAVRNNEQLVSALRILRIRPLSLGEEYDYYNKIRSAKDAVSFQPGVLRVRLAVRGSSTFVSDMFDIFSIDTLLADNAFHSPSAQSSWLQSRSFTAMRTDKQDSFQLCMRIPDTSHVSSSLGYLMVEVDRQALLGPLHSLVLPNDGFLLLHDGDQILYQSGAAPWQEEGLAPLLAKMRGDAGYVPLEAPVNGAWRLVVGIPRGSLIRPGEHLPLMILWMAVILSALGVAFALMVTQSINKRLQLTMDGIRRVESGELGVTIPVIGSDEYSTMQTAFNHMSIRIEQLVADLLQSQAQQKQAELRLLYEQINPHFVYNTLDVIRWEALRAGADPLAGLADTLVAYLRQSLNHGQEMIEVSREIDMIDRYMAIMNFRYQGAVSYQSWIDESIADVRMIKMVLQPLVENAVLHGIMSSQAKRGSIDVRGWREGDALCFCVSDEGAGITPQKLASLTQPGLAHYGLWNVQERIRAQYGPQSGLTIESEQGKWTKVRVTMRGVFSAGDVL